MLENSNGYFVAGKYDQLQGDVPYSAFKDALRNLLRFALGDDERRFGEWRSKLCSALGANAQIVVDFLPELRLVMGEQRPVPDLEPNESQNRFYEVLKRFLAVFADFDRPLVIFLDDVQWIDPATLRFLRIILCDLDVNNLMVIGAYRSNEVDGMHLLTQGISYFEHNGANVSHLGLDALSHTDVTHLLADTLDAPKDKVSGLAKVAIRKTNGNPFFIKEFISASYQNGLIEFDLDNYKWIWNAKKIDEMDITDNVVDLLKQRMKSLPGSTVEILNKAACVGSEFGLGEVANIANTKNSDAFQVLKPAIDEGFVYEVEEPSFGNNGNLNTSITSDNKNFAFSHDRIQQAAYSLTTDDDRNAIHLKIGRYQMAQLSDDKPQAFSFDAVDHLNRGQDLITSDSEILKLSQLNLAAGIQAKKAGAYRAANSYLETARELTSEKDLSVETKFLFELYRESAEVTSLLGEFDLVDAFIDKALLCTDSLTDKAAMRNLSIVQLTLNGSYHEAINIGRDVLSSLGVPLPADDCEAELREELQKAHSVDAQDKESILANLNPMSDEPTLVAMKILMNLFPPTHSVNPQLNSWIAVKMVNLSMEHGYAPETPKGFANYGSVLAARGKYKEGFAFGELALQIADAYKIDELKPRILYAFLGDLNHWIRPLQKTRDLVDEAFVGCIQHGELQYAGYILTFARCMNEIFLGDNQKLFLEKVNEAVQFVRKTKNTHAESVSLATHMATCNLLGDTDSYNSFDTESVSENTFIRVAESRDDFARDMFSQNSAGAKSVYLWSF